MAPLWQPLLDDMSAQIGVKVKPYFSSNYTSQIEAMRFKQVQVGWFSALPALDAVERADGEVLGRVIDAGGDATYKSVIIVHKGSGITLDKLLACGQKYTFGIGDPQSTSGTLAPMAYLFTPKGIEPAKCFKAVRSASHQANSFSVANGVLDVATNNTVGILFFQREKPELAAKLETIWTSPALPESSIVARKDLDPAIKEKMRQFFLTYGTGTGPTADKQRAVLKGLAYGGFTPGRQLLPRPDPRDAGRRGPGRGAPHRRRGQDRRRPGRLRQDPRRRRRRSAPRSRTSDDGSPPDPGARFPRPPQRSLVAARAGHRSSGAR